MKFTNMPKEDGNTELAGRVRWNNSDRIIAQMVNVMSDAALEKFNMLKADDFLHYMSEQKEWIEKENYFLGIALGRPPTNGDLIKDMANRRIRERYKAFYCIKYFDRVSSDLRDSSGRAA
ncbi:MAG: hypothetical protein AABX65_03710 [Nanoarchaeota archaeon]